MQTLTPEERKEYEGLQLQNNKQTKGRSKNAKSKTELDPVVDDANVIETIDVSTSQNAQNNSRIESDESEEDDDEDEEEEEEQPKVMMS